MTRSDLSVQLGGTKAEATILHSIGFVEHIDMGGGGAPLLSHPFTWTPGPGTGGGRTKLDALFISR